MNSHLLKAVERGDEPPENSSFVETRDCLRFRGPERSAKRVDKIQTIRTTVVVSRVVVEERGQAEKQRRSWMIHRCRLTRRQLHEW